MMIRSPEGGGFFTGKGIWLDWKRIWGEAHRGMTGDLQLVCPQYFPPARSLVGRISRHVVHQPVRTVSMNGAGSSSAFISAASAR